MVEQFRGKAQQGAVRKGREAFLAGQSESSCPYQDKRGGQHDHIITWSRSFISAWLHGYRAAESESTDARQQEPE